MTTMFQFPIKTPPKKKKKFQSKLNMSLIRKKNCVPNIQLLFYLFMRMFNFLFLLLLYIYIYIYIYFNQNVQLME